MYGSSSSSGGHCRGGGSGASRGRGGYRGGRGGYRGGNSSFGQLRLSSESRLHARETPLPAPSSAYLDATLLPSTTLPLDQPVPSTHPAPIVVLSLNKAIVYRKFRTASGAQKPCVRPYLSTFLTYLCGINPPSSSSSDSDAASVSSSVASPDLTRFRPVIYSAMRGPNLLTLLSAINLIPSHRLPPRPYSTRYSSTQHLPAYEPDFADGDVLSLVLSRETMGLTEEEYESDVQATKNLKKVWEGLDLETEDGGVDELEEALAGLSLAGQGGGSRGIEEKGARVTVLLDDEVEAAAQFPYSLLRVTTFEPTDRYSSSSTYSSFSTTTSSATELPSSHPDGQDEHLLTLIYLLERLRHETNISAALRGGLVDKVKDEIKAELGGEASTGKVDAELAKRGRKVCEDLGIEVRRSWDVRWREKMLDKEEGRA
ncbi:hypothetical protein JCM10213_003075 [Rhodosporidiobolus nylandii]